MADSSVTFQTTVATPPSGTVVSTRTNASGEQLQVVAVGIDGSDSIVPSTAANGLTVDVTRVQGTVAVTSDAVASTTVTQVASSATNVTLKASNASRKGLYVFNDSTAALFVKFGATASATSFTVKIAAGGYYEMPTRPTYTGIVDGIWSAANGNAYVTEL